MKSVIDIEEGLLSVKEAARLLGLKSSTLYRYAWARRIRTYHVGRALRFAKADLLALVRERPAIE